MTPKPVRLAIAQTLCRPCPPFISQRLRAIIYPDHCARADNYSCRAQAQTGSFMDGVTSDYYFQKFCVHGFYDWRNVVICLALASTSDTIIEVGANVGTETISFADIVGPRGTVHAFEPFPLHVETLRKANQASQHQNIRVYPVALSDGETSAQFLPPPGHNSGVGQVTWGRAADETKAITVRVTTLDTVVDQQRIGAAKIIFTDAEGEELNVVRGGIRYLERHRPHLVIEAAPPLFRAKGQSIEDLYATLRRLGYEVFGVARFGLARVRDPRRTPDRQNWVCVPSERQTEVRRVRRAILRCGLSPLVFNLNPLRRHRSATT